MKQPRNYMTKELVLAQLQRQVEAPNIVGGFFGMPDFVKLTLQTLRSIAPPGMEFTDEPWRNFVHYRTIPITNEQAQAILAHNGCS
jgi:hypothetical protein